MNKDIFWQIIEKSKQADEMNNLYDRCDILQNELYSLSCEDILIFKAIFDIYHQLSYKMRLWAAAYVINSGCSDLAFEYFRAGLIIQGKEVYLNTLKNPEYLAHIGVNEGEWEIEEVLHICRKPFLEKLGLRENAYEEFLDAQEMFRLDRNEIQTIVAEIEYGKDIDDIWDESDLFTLVPNLCKAFAWRY